MTRQKTNLAHAHQERDEAQKRFEITFDANPAPSMIVRLEDRQVLEVNIGLGEITGRDCDEVKERRIGDLELFTDVDEFEQIIEGLKQGRSISQATLQLHSVTQGSRTVLVSAAPITLDEGVCGLFTFADVTELNQAQELFSQVFQLAPTPITLMNTELQLVEVNRSFEQFTGYTRSEVAGRSNRSLNLWPVPKDFQKLREVFKENAEVNDLELALLTKAGEERQVLGSARRLNVSGKQVLMHIFYDVTERRRSEREVHQAIQSVMTDARWFSQKVVDQLAHLRPDNRLKRLDEVQLTSRELQILERIAVGMPNKDIAVEINLGLQTVRNYVTAIYLKLGVHSRTEAAIWARERGIVNDS